MLALQNKIPTLMGDIMKATSMFKSVCSLGAGTRERKMFCTVGIVVSRKSDQYWINYEC